MDQDVQVELPGIFNPDPETKAQVDPLKLSVAKKGEYYINVQQYDLNGVIDYLSEQHAEDPYRRLVLRADAKLKYGQIREFMGRIQSVGFPGVNFMVGEKHKEGARATRDLNDETKEGGES
jgi:biopolymer transport protein ExbD